MTQEITGIAINGTASIGFITTGRPNKIGSLILKSAGTNSKFPNVFNCFDFANATK